MDDKTIEMHRAILMAYISRLTLADMRDLLACREACTHAGMNLGTRSQIDAHARLDASVCRTINNLIKHDLALIESVIERETCSQ